MAEPEVHRPLHIVYVVERGGGADTYAQEIGALLAARGHRITVLYLHQPGQAHVGPLHRDGIVARHVEMRHVHWYYDRIRRRLPRPLRNRLPHPSTAKAAEASFALRHALHEIQREAAPIDLIEVFEAIAYPLLFRHIAPYAVKLHSADFTWKYFCGEGLGPADRKRISLERDLLRQASRVSSPSAALADHVASFCSYPRSDIEVLPYPLDSDRFRPSDTKTPGAAPPRSVLFVGRLVHRKGLGTLAAAAGRILAHAPNATIDIVGGDTDEISARSLRLQVPETVRDRFICHGRVPHDLLPDLYRRAAVCVVPSRWDNSPNTVYEAMGCGTPVVASRVGGIPELVVEGETGILVPPDDSDALAGAVVSILSSPARRQAMGKAARARACDQFHPDRIADQTVSLYYRALLRDWREPPRTGTG